MSTATGPVLPKRVLQGAIGVLLVLKLVMLLVPAPFMDEAYYWMWGQHPSLSYFDHPPMIAWTEGLAALAFGWSSLGVRAFVLLALVGDIVVLALFARRLSGATWREEFRVSLALFCAIPIFFALTGLALPDHLLIFFSLLSLFWFTDFLLDWRDTGPARYGPLYLAALSQGLALLSKYNAVLLGIGVAAFVVTSPRYRALLRRWQLYLAVLIVGVVQLPVIIWNLQHGFASVLFTFENRRGATDWVSGLSGYVLGIVVMLSPFLLPPLARLLFGRSQRAPDDPAQGLARSIFLASSAVFLFASLTKNILIHWNIIAYVGVMPFIAPYFRSRPMMAGQLVFGGLFALVVAFNYTVMPVTALVDTPDQTSAWSYGWKETAERVKAAAVSNGARVIAATDYTLASSLGFALADRDVTSLSPDRDEFDFWFDPEAHRGETVVLVADQWRPVPDELEARFSSLVLAESVPILRFGHQIDMRGIYIGREFAP